jgi:ketoreductase RED1
MAQPSSQDGVLDRRRRVAVIGAGTIGASWAALFAAAGLEVRVHDPSEDTPARLDSMWQQAAPVLADLGFDPSDPADRLQAVGSLEEALEGADVVQENGPEDVRFKRQLWATAEQIVRADALLVSSTSGIRASAQSKEMNDRSRVLVGHPFNPPHLVPLVEVVPAPETRNELVDEAVAFYRALGKRPLVVRKEVPGFVANRLQSALFRECVHLVADGVVDIADLDQIVTASLGLRWATGGPFLSFHLGGGPGGLPHFLRHLGPGMESMWGILGDPRLDQDTVDLLERQIASAYGDSSIESLERRRDRQQVSVLQALSSSRAPDSRAQPAEG